MFRTTSYGGIEFYLQFTRSEVRAAAFRVGALLPDRLELGRERRLKYDVLQQVLEFVARLRVGNPTAGVDGAQAAPQHILVSVDLHCAHMEPVNAVQRNRSLTQSQPVTMKCQHI